MEVAEMKRERRKKREQKELIKMQELQRQRGQMVPNEPAIASDKDDETLLWQYRKEKRQPYGKTLLQFPSVLDHCENPVRNLKISEYTFNYFQEVRKVFAAQFKEQNQGVQSGFFDRCMSCWVH